MSAILLQPERDQLSVLVVGTGLIGSEVASIAKKRLATSRQSLIPFDWNSPEIAAERLLQALEARADKAGHRLELFWCAGRAGFHANADEMEGEQQAYEYIVSRFDRLCKGNITVNFLSSAGGLYEGSEGVINQETSPCALRVYGKSKLIQEKFLKDNHIPSRVYRPSTVYGVARPGVRKGLISALVSNTLNRLPTAIHANPDTLRDFIYVGDVARIMVGNALSGGFIGATRILASGRPLSITYLIQKVADVLGKRPNVHFVPSAANEKDIVFSNRCLQQGYPITSIEEGVSLLAKLQWNAENIYL